MNPTTTPLYNSAGHCTLISAFGNDWRVVEAAAFQDLVMDVNDLKPLSFNYLNR